MTLTSLMAWIMWCRLRLLEKARSSTKGEHWILPAKFEDIALKGLTKRVDPRHV